jgi:hypothetical protein
MHRKATALQVLEWVSHPCKCYIQDFISKRKTLKLNTLIKQNFIQFSPSTLMSLAISRVHLQNKETNKNYYAHPKSITLSKWNCMPSLPYIYGLLYFNTMGTFMLLLEFWGWLWPINHTLTHPWLSNILHTISFIVTHTWREVILTDRHIILNL